MKDSISHDVNGLYKCDVSICSEYSQTKLYKRAKLSAYRQVRLHVYWSQNAD